MQYILTPAQMRETDRYMMEMQGIPGVVLMEHAALGVTETICEWIGQVADDAPPVGIVCGGGNNGGDGLAVLRQLAMRGIPAWAALLVAPEALAGDARLQYDMARSAGLLVHTIGSEEALAALPWQRAGVLVDALFGTGLSRPLAGLPMLAVRHMNQSPAKVVAVDIPSGVDGATGRVLGAAVQADATIAFQHKKLGHLLLPGRKFAGTLRVVPIGLPGAPTYAAEQWEEADVRRLLPTRPLDSHKGANGRALLLAGSTRYGGAALLAASAALRAGTGLLYVGVPQLVQGMFAACPAAISQPVGRGGEWDADTGRQALPLLTGKDAIAIGPGMGAGDGVVALLQAALDTGTPIIIDADGLNALAKHKTLLRALHAEAILTPHPGEMARLTGISREEILEAPMQAAQQAATAWGCTVLLKDATSVVAAQGKTCLNTTGNPGLAKGGSGDVLTGILLGLLSQGLRGYEAACVGAYLLGSTADTALRLLHTRALLATDVVEWITRSID